MSTSTTKDSPALKEVPGAGTLMLMTCARVALAAARIVEIAKTAFMAIDCRE